jgi:hypothetical protein
VGTTDASLAPVTVSKPAITEIEEPTPVAKEEPTPDGGALAPVTVSKPAITEIEEPPPVVREEPPPVVREEPTPNLTLAPVTVTTNRSADGLDIVGDKTLGNSIADFVGKQINQNFAEQQGFPDYATYLQYGGDKAAYEASKVAATDPTLAPVTVTTKALQDDLDITSPTGTNRVTDSSVPVNPNVGTTAASLAPVTITGKRELEDLIPLEVMPPLPSSKVTPVIAGTPKEETKPIVLPNLSATQTTSARKPTPSQAQRLADAFAVPTLANTFYGNADFSTKKVEVDDEGNIIEVPYEPIDVSKPASKSLLANGGQITDNSTNHLVALLNHIMGSQDRNQLTEDDLLNIVRKGI